VLQQVGVGWVVDVGLDHGGVDPQLAGPQHPVGGQLGQQRGVELPDHFGAGAAHQLDQGSRVRHRPIQRDAAEPPPRDGVADFLAQRLVAQPVAVLEVQQAQQGVDGNRRPPEPGREQRPPRRDEALVVQVGVDPGEFDGQPLGLLGQQRVPQGGLGVGLAEHRHLQRRELQQCHSTTNRTRPPTFPQLNRYLSRDFFRSK
jgi:hypothetical protein